MLRGQQVAEIQAPEWPDILQRRLFRIRLNNRNLHRHRRRQRQVRRRRRPRRFQV